MLYILWLYIFYHAVRLITGYSSSYTTHLEFAVLGRQSIDLVIECLAHALKLRSLRLSDIESVLDAVAAAEGISLGALTERAMNRETT